MRSIVKKAMRDEKGAALVLTLVLLLVGGLVIAPLLGFMGTGIIAGEVHEKRMDELYAADAGVEKAFWYIVSEGYIPSEDSLTANEKEVDIYIEKDVDGCRTYRVTSIATTEGVSSTTVEAYIAPTSFLNNAITSRTNVNLLNGDVYGNVQYGGEPDDNKINNTDIWDGELINNEYGIWPDLNKLSTHYLKDVEGFEPDPRDTIDVAEYASTIPSLFRGDWDDLERELDLTITNSDPEDPTIQLQGTIYITGDLTFPQTGAGAKSYTIDLNGKTIFARGDIRFPSHAVRITGTGAIIAGGDITFNPGMTSNPDNYVLVMSIGGTIDFKPSVEPSGGTFYGSLVGNASVDMNNASIVWRSPPADLNFPIELFETMVMRSWHVSLQTLP